MEVATLGKMREKVSDVGLPSIDVDGQALDDALDRIIDGHSSISMLLVSTSDGRAIAHRSLASIDPRRLSAMSNSFLTLGETLSRELGLSTADHVTISTPQGSMVLVRIAAARPYTLAALGHSSTSLAILLYVARDAANRIKPLL